MSRFDKNNITKYLIFFGQNVGKNFSEESLKKWQELTPDAISEHLKAMYNSLGIADQVSETYENEFFTTLAINDNLSDFVPISPNMDVISTQQESVKPTSNRRFEPEEAELIPIVKTEPARKSIEPISKQAVKKGKSYWKLIVALIIIGVLAFVWFKYDMYKNRPRVYCLTQDVNVWQEVDNKDKMRWRMDFQGKYMLKGSHKSEKSFESLPLFSSQPEDGYYKVVMDTSFMQYLLSGSDDNVAYVHKNMVTTSKADYDAFREVFSNFDEDYNEMAQLPLIYRNIIVRAILNNSILNGKILGAPCYKENKVKDDAPVSIGHMRIKNNANRYDYYVVARMDDGKYYSIKSNEDANLIEVSETQLIDYNNQAGLTEPGKFKVKLNKGVLYGELVWSNCDNEKSATSSVIPFNEFETENSKESKLQQIADSIIDAFHAVTDSVIN